jgi:hypothetical protein
MMNNLKTVINSLSKKTLRLIRKRQVQGLRSQKKHSLHKVNASAEQCRSKHFSDKSNEEIGVFLQTLNK